MTAQHNFISGKTENILKKLTVQSSGNDTVGRSTKTNPMPNRVESGACFFGVCRAQFIALMIWNDTHTQSDLREMRYHLMRLCVTESDWFESKRYLSDLAYRKKVDGLIDCVVQHVKLSKPITNESCAKFMRCSTSTYRNKAAPWKLATIVLKDTFNELLHDAAQKVHKLN